MEQERSLPIGWTWKNLGEIAQLLRGVSYRKEDASDKNREGFVPILRATNIQDEKLIIDNDLVYVPSKYVKGEQYLKSGDIVVCMSSGSKHLVGKTAQLIHEWNGSFGTFCAALRPYATINAKLMSYFFSSAEYRKFIREKSAGININNLKPSDFESLLIPVPPLPEQERIVAKIEELFTQLEAGTAALRRIQAGLKRYKASVLKAACEGRLVAQDPSDEPAEELLRRMGKKPLEGEGLPGLPLGWCWGKIADIGADVKYAIVDGPFGSMLKVSDYVVGGDYPVLTISNIDDGFETDKLRYITKEKFNTIKRSAVHPGDILVAKIGASYGKVGYYPEWMPIGVIPANLLKITVDEMIKKDYIFYYLQNVNFKKRLDKITKSTAQPAFNVSMFRELPIPIPPLVEQHRIVAEIERQLSVATEIEATVAGALVRSARLRQAILKQAFEGKLV